MPRLPRPNRAPRPRVLTWQEHRVLRQAHKPGACHSVRAIAKRLRWPRSFVRELLRSASAEAGS